MEQANERLLRVLGDVGSDLIDTAEKKRFPRSLWQKLLPLAACLAVFAALGCWTLPYFLPKGEQTAATRPAEAPAVIQMPDFADEAEYASGQEASEARATRQLVFWDMAYYVEATYTSQEAAPLLGSRLGTVEKADDGVLLGAAVFARRDAQTRADAKGREIPLEIFVETREGQYLYCLTYYAGDAPVLTMTQATAWAEGAWTGDLQSLVAPVAALGAVQLLQAADLEPAQLLTFFLATLEIERQTPQLLLDRPFRTEDLDRYLWHDGENYVIPADDLRRQLDKYLDSFCWEPEKIPGYDAALHAVVRENLNLPGSELGQAALDETACSLDRERRLLTLAMEWEDGSRQVYVLRLDEDRCVFERMEKEA